MTKESDELADSAHDHHPNYRRLLAEQVENDREIYAENEQLEARLLAAEKQLALAEAAIARIRAHRTHLGSSRLGFPDEYEAALAEYDMGKPFPADGKSAGQGDVEVGSGNTPTTDQDTLRDSATQPLTDRERPTDAPE